MEVVKSLCCKCVCVLVNSRFVCKNNGVIYENQLLQIGLKSEYRQNLGEQLYNTISLQYALGKSCQTSSLLRIFLKDSSDRLVYNEKNQV